MPLYSNPTDILYYDCYDAAPYLMQGENVIGVCLGNGFMNALDAGVWDFEKASWRSAPQVALSLRIVDEDGAERFIDTTEGFVTTPSPIRFDDLRFGETYDAREELPGWDMPGFDASAGRRRCVHRIPAGNAACAKPNRLSSPRNSGRWTSFRSRTATVTISASILPACSV